MTWQDTPLFIISFNNYSRGFRSLIDWLRSADCRNITVIDNHSTWQPLLDYYAESHLRIARLSENMGHEVFWKLGWHLHQKERFIVTDPDVVPDTYCPKDLILQMHKIADKLGPCKVGPGIRIDNLPDHYHLKQLMLDSECGYWHESRFIPEHGCYRADLDTTFAMYEPGMEHWPQAPHYRLDFPYVVEHIPWYLNSSESHAERDYYKATVLPGISHSQ